MRTYRCELVGGPYCGRVIPRGGELPDEIVMEYGPHGPITDEVIYRRMPDERANPWRYMIASQRLRGQ